MPIPKCEVCERDLNERPLYASKDANGARRVGIWRCGEHVETPPDPEVQSLVNLIHTRGM